MSLRRRFVYLVVDGGCNRRRSCRDSYSADTFHMRRINMSRFFYPEPAAAAETAATVVDARLPRPCITFCASSPMHFMLLGRDKVLAMDRKGRATMYDPGANTIRPAPTLTNPKSLPAISLPIGDSLYILDPKNSDDQCFEALVYKPAGRMDKHNDWHCQSLPPPPYVPRSCSFVDAYGAIAAYAVVGGSDSDSAEIWVSTNDGDGGTFSFDTARRAWTNHGDWKLPFRGLAEYVPEYNLWFGLSNNNTNHLCAFDLAGTAKLQSPPPPRNFCKDFKPPKDWQPVSSYLVHLGSGRFCIARFFHKRVKIPVCCYCDIDMDTKLYGVFTGVEVKAGRGLRMVKHSMVSDRTLSDDECSSDKSDSKVADSDYANSNSEQEESSGSEKYITKKDLVSTLKDLFSGSLKRKRGRTDKPVKRKKQKRSTLEHDQDKPGSLDSPKPRSRPNVTYFSNLIQGLSKEQRSTIEKSAFGSLLNFQRCAIPLSFVKWIARHTDVFCSDIVVNGRSIPINPNPASFILGIPNGGLEIRCDSDAGKQFFHSHFIMLGFPF